MYLDKINRIKQYMADLGWTIEEKIGSEGWSKNIDLCLDFFRYIGDEPSDTEEKIRHYILPIRPNRADRRKVTPKPAVYFLYRIT